MPGHLVKEEIAEADLETETTHFSFDSCCGGTTPTFWAEIKPFWSLSDTLHVGSSRDSSSVDSNFGTIRIFSCGQFLYVQHIES